MSKYFLDDEFDYDFKLIGITSHSTDYRISWSINQSLKINLSKEKDITLDTKKAGVVSFSNYSFEDIETEKGYRLLANKYNKQLLIPEQKAGDFLFILYEIGEEELKNIMDALRKINIVLMCFEINVSNLKSKQNLLF